MNRRLARTLLRIAMPVAALIVILWDYLNTLSDENRYIWT